MNADDDPILRLVAEANPVEVVDEQARRRPRRLSKPATAGAGVAGVLIVGALAAATGVVPGGVLARMGLVSSPGAAISDVRMLVEHVNADGIRDQLWVARDSAGQHCQDVRSVRRGAEDNDGAVSCGTENSSTRRLMRQPLIVEVFAGGSPHASGTYDVVVHTTLPSATRVDVVYPDQQQFALTYNPDNGWAIGVVPPGVSAMSGVLLVTDSSGAVIARHRMPATQR